MPARVPEVLAAWMRPFRGYFTTAVWRHTLVLVAGAPLAPGGRTVTTALRVMGLAGPRLCRPPPRARPRAVVFPCCRASALAPARRGLRANGAGGGGHRRHDRTTLGGQDQGAWHLP